MRNHRRLRILVSGIRHDEHKLKLTNHLFAATSTTMLTGIAVGWTMIPIVTSALLPSVWMEVFDYLFKL